MTSMVHFSAPLKLRLLIYMEDQISSIPLILTKLHRPSVANDHLHRQHLLDWLNLRMHHPLTLVSAPAGYGKTTLMTTGLTDWAAWSSPVLLQRISNR